MALLCCELDWGPTEREERGQELKKSHEREISEPEYFLPGRVKAGCVSCFEVRFSQELIRNTC